MKTLVLASRNAGKLEELETLLAPHHFEVRSQAEFDVPSPEETGLTFIENALIKARAVTDATGVPSLGDDSGIVVPLLGGAPGIYSARYAGTHGDDAANNAKLVSTLSALDAASEQRGTHTVLAPAYFYCAMAYLEHAADPTPVIATAAWHGHIVAEARGSDGFGYDPHFLTEHGGEALTAAELPAAIKNQRSLRGQALTQLLTMLLDGAA